VIGRRWPNIQLLNTYKVKLSPNLRKITTFNVFYWLKRKGIFFYLCSEKTYTFCVVLYCLIRMCLTSTS